MKRNISICLVVAAFALVVFSPGIVVAHEDVSSEQSDHSLTVHIDPTESPVAGQESTITYFITDEYPDRPFTAKITVNGIDDKQFAELDPVISEEAIISKYTFPEQGSYKLELKIKESSSDADEVFTESVQVTAAQETSAKVQPKKGMSNLAKGAIVGVNVVLIGVMGYGVSRRQEKSKK